MKTIPLADKEDAKGGWMFDFEFVNHIASCTAAMAFPSEMEEVEGVLLVLMQEGYVQVEDKE